MKAQHILIAGGGIGGLAASLALSKQGFDVSVFEQAGEFSEIGAGIQLSPNCTRVLFDAGLEDALHVIAFVPRATQMRHWRTGKLITTSPLGTEVLKAYGFPYFHAHRADLIEVLSDAAAQADNITLHTNAAVHQIHETEQGVAIALLDGRAFQGDVLIGADGIHSVVREHLFGADAPVFTGNIAWRALIPVNRLPKNLIAPASTVRWGPGKHFVHYYVRRGELVNCVCVVEKQGWQVESWNERGEHEELKTDFAGWHDDVQTLIDAADRDSLYKWALFDRKPMAQWGRGCVTLLGDACHPMLPFMAQGAAMAIEDGAVLARCLKQDGTIPDQLKHYENLRRERTARIQIGSRRNATVFHMRGLKAMVRNFTAKRTPIAGRAMAGLFGYNALTAHGAAHGGEESPPTT